MIRVIFTPEGIWLVRLRHVLFFEPWMQAYPGVAVVFCSPRPPSLAPLNSWLSMIFSIDIEVKRSCQLKSLSLIACKLVIRKMLVNNQNLNKKSSSLYWYNCIPLWYIPLFTFPNSERNNNYPNLTLLSFFNSNHPYPLMTNSPLFDNPKR